MKRITLAMLFAAVTAAPMLAQDPVPPTPPARPAPQPAPAAPAPRALPARPMDQLDRDLLRQQAELDRLNRDIVRIAPMAIDVDEMRAQGRIFADQARAMADVRVNMNIDVDAMREASRVMALDATRMAMDMPRDFAPYAPMAIAPMPAMPALAPMAPMPFGGFAYEDRVLRSPPAPWAQGDPADSLYKVARNVLGNGDYGRAAKLFSEISKNYPKSAYATDAPYWEATARYKIGTTEELKNAAKLLEPMVAKITTPVTTNVSNGRGESFGFPAGRGRYTNDSDVATLYARINGVLAQRGDREAADKIAKAAAQGGPTCDQEDMSVKAEALNALSQMDPASATPFLRRVLDRKDECSASLRRNAVFMLGRRTDTESANLLISVAKSDPNYSVRTSAIDALSRSTGDAGFAALEELLRTDQDERIQRSVVSALMRSDNQKARNSMRALIDRKDAPVNLRIEAIQSFNSDRATTEDGAYLRGLYPKAETDGLKRAIIDAVARVGGPENDQWILALARNTNETSQVRSEAISRLMRSNITIADVGKLYDASDSFNMRQQIINVLRSRKEPEATDKLIDIIKNGTDANIRRQAISALNARNDPRSQQLLMDIIDGVKKP